jgi:acetyltransferase
MLVRFTQIDYHNEMALVAVKQTGDTEEEIGVARYVTNPDKKSCEFALVVSDRWQRKGIGHHLMRRLMDSARERGLETMVGEVLRDNIKMLELIGNLGFRASNHPEDRGIVQVETKLA